MKLILRAFCAAVLLLASSVSAQQTRDKYDPSFRDLNKVVAVAPLFVEPFEVSEEQRSAFMSQFEARLDKLGFDVVSSETFAPIWNGKMEELGGYYDPYSGERIEEKYATVRDHTYSTLAQDHEIDAYFFPRITVVEAELQGASASWDGVSERLVKGFWEAMSTDASVKTSIPALSLKVEARDGADALLYEGVGGVELMIRQSNAGRETLGPDQILLDEKRNKKAVSKALGAVTKRPRKRKPR